MIYGNPVGKNHENRIATSSIPGIVKPFIKKGTMITEVGVDSEGRLFADRDPDIDTLQTRLKSTLLEHADLHLGFYLDENGDLCQKED